MSDPSIVDSTAVRDMGDREPMPYYQDDHVTLYHGDMRELLPELGITADACVTDPPYGETSLAWDRWVDGWPALVAECTRSMWCFGSMRMFLHHCGEFKSWKLSQDVVWDKGSGTGFAADRFKRTHELALHFYIGEWSAVNHAAVRERHHGPRRDARQRGGIAHTGKIATAAYVDDGRRLVRTIIPASNRRGQAIHPTEKPTAILSPLIEYSVPPGGLVIDPFAGSFSVGLTARHLGRRAIGIEANEEYCERAAKRLSVPDLFDTPAGG